METKPCLDASCFIPALPVTRQITSALQHRISIFNILKISGGEQEIVKLNLSKVHAPAPASFISNFQIDIMCHVLAIFPWLPPYHVTAPAACPDLTLHQQRFKPIYE